MWTKRILPLFLLLGLVLSPAVFAQEPQTQPPQKKDAPAAGDEAIDPGDLPEGVFIYRPMGRRDPFWDLLRGKNIKNSRESIEGIEGLMIDELDLEGTFYVDGKFKALLKGPDGLPYVVTEGQKVYDGELIRIDRYTVVFKKILTVALGGKKEKIIEKRLNPDEEEGIK